MSFPGFICSLKMYTDHLNEEDVQFQKYSNNMRVAAMCELLENPI